MKLRILLACCLSVGAAVSFAGAVEQESSGASIYFEDRNGLACAGCHGIAGTGGGEGGINIPPLTGTVGPDNRYANARNLCRLLATGLTPERIRISNLMPRYTLSEKDCANLFRFTSAFGQPVLGPEAAELPIVSRIDNRSSGQTSWISRINKQLDKANESGGIFGRRFAIGAATDVPSSPGTNPIVVIDFMNSAAEPSNGAAESPTIVLQARNSRPLVKAIESSPLDEARAIIAAFPGETILFVDPMKLGPTIEALRAAVDQPTVRIVGIEACGTATVSPTRAIIMSMATTPDQGLSALQGCKALQGAAVSLRNVNSGAIAKAAAAARLPASVSVFTPVPVDEQFGDIPNVVARIIVEMARRMGANPSRSIQIEAFEQAWKLHARGDGTLFSGASITEVDPTDLSAKGPPLWHEAP